jgi:cytidine deaminase
MPSMPSVNELEATRPFREIVVSQELQICMDRVFLGNIQTDALQTSLPLGHDFQSIHAFQRGFPMWEIPAETLERLKAAAKSVSEHAYCPYSKFRVGAAVLTQDGQTFSGCNVENASYGLTICAERNAIFQMAAKAKQPLQVIVIYTPTKTPSAPCGACRQVINEFGPEAEVISFCEGPGVLRKKLSELLPDAFGPHNLEKDRPGA